MAYLLSTILDAMEALKSFNLLAMFIIEVALLIAFGEIGLSLQAPLFVRVVTALALVGFVIFMWATWLAPKAKNRLELPWLAVAKCALFALASVGQYLMGNNMNAFVLMSAFVLIEMLALIWHQENPNAHGE